MKSSDLVIVERILVILYVVTSILTYILIKVLLPQKVPFAWKLKRDHAIALHTTAVSFALPDQLMAVLQVAKLMILHTLVLLFQ